MLRVRVAAGLSAVVLAACPAPPLDEHPDWDRAPFDAVPGDLVLAAPPSCAPESVIDLDANGVRNGNLLSIAVDTRTARNELHPRCVPADSNEVVLRYTSPALADHVVAAIRVTSITLATIANASGEPMLDPTDYDTVLSIRTGCDGRDLDCNNDAFVRDPSGVTHVTRRSNLYEVGVQPETVYLIVVDGYDGSAGSALVTLEEIPELGVAGAPCEPIPAQRAIDPTAPTAYFRCPHPGIACRPEAAADGTDLCVPIVPLGARCDPHGHFDVCARADEGAICAQNPSVATDVVCALPGTAAGTPCRGLRGMPDRCDAHLYCAQQPADSRAPDECVPIRAAGESCDPTGEINHCDAGLTCCAVTADAGAETVCGVQGSASCFPARTP